MNIIDVIDFGLVDELAPDHLHVDADAGAAPVAMMARHLLQVIHAFNLGRHIDLQKLLTGIHRHVWT